MASPLARASMAHLANAINLLRWTFAAVDMRICKSRRRLLAKSGAHTRSNRFASSLRVDTVVFASKCNKLNKCCDFGALFPRLLKLPYSLVCAEPGHKLFNFRG